MSEPHREILPGPWVNPRNREAEPWRTATGIVKFIEFVVRIPEMTHRDFHLYWQKHHSPHVLNVTPFAQFMRKYNTTHRFPDATGGIPARYRQDHAFEGTAEVWLNSAAEVGDWLGHPLYAALIQPDEPRFIAQDGQTALIVTKEEPVLEADPDLDENDLVKVHLILGRAPGVERDMFHASASRTAKAMAADPALARHLLKFVVAHRLPDPNPVEGLAPVPIDVVLELWFADRAALRAFFAEASLSCLGDWEEAFVDRASARAIAAKVKVVHDEFSFQRSVTQPFAFSWDEPGDAGR